MITDDLAATAERTRAANEARTPEEWTAIATEALVELRASLSRAIEVANADVPKDSPMAPAGALVTASFVHIGKLGHALDWLGRCLQKDTVP